MCGSINEETPLRPSALVPNLTQPIRETMFNAIPLRPETDKGVPKAYLGSTGIALSSPGTA
jgi:hypothetical protein